MMVAQAAGVDYERMIAGEYKLLIEPIAYFTHNGQYYCMTASAPLALVSSGLMKLRRKEKLRPLMSNTE